MRKLAEYTVIFVFGGLCYGFIEIMNRGFSHITMGILGGASMCVIHALNTERRKGMNMWLIMLISSVFITSVEFISGEFLNMYLGMNIWSYSDIPLNIDGQICLPFVGIWFVLSFVGLAADDFIRYKIFKGPKNFNYFGKQNVTARVH